MLHRKALLVLVAVAAYFVLPANSNAQGKNSYEGVQVCGMCHKTEKSGNQLKIWQDSKHSQAYKTLLTAKADEISKKKSGKKAVENPECLKCHATGYNVDKALVGAKFKVEDGVQCETCHGAGSGYKSMSVMKNKAEAEKKGLVMHSDIEKFCKTCHNPESPSYKEFKFQEMWKKIEHKVPKG
ncbi:MAG: cytochrome C554 [Bacteroidetes bacterium]|nr:cytochrome C554 [Bacteroidota bacterium]